MNLQEGRGKLGHKFHTDANELYVIFMILIISGYDTALNELM